MTQEPTNFQTPTLGDDMAIAAQPVAIGGAGHSLRELRQARGLSLEDVSRVIKFSVRQLQAVENQDWPQLPTGVLLRGMVRSYARMLQCSNDDIDRLLDQLPQDAKRPDTVYSGLRTGIASPMLLDEAPTAPVAWGWLLAIVVVVIAAVVYAFMRGWLPSDWLHLGHFFDRK